MRGSSASRNIQPPTNQTKIARESEQIMKRIGQIKEGMSPQMTSNMKFGSQHRQKWERYLPMENNNNNLHSFASVSHHQKQDPKLDQYRQSLESRLEKLFREEKELLKERHLMSSYGGASQGKTKDGDAKVFNHAKAEMSNSIDRMDRKIKMLEEKYQQGQKDQQKKEKKDYKEKKEKKYQQQGRSVEAKQNDFNATTTKTENQMMAQEKHELGSPAIIQGNGRGRVRSEVLVQEDAHESREHRLEQQMQELKANIVEIKQSNKELTRRMHHKEEKRKYKQRTKEILQNILHKLEFINVEISSAKKRAKGMGMNVGGGNLGESRQAGKMQQQAQELMTQFQTLKVQYRHLDEKRKKVERRQSEIESKLCNLVPK